MFIFQMLTCFVMQCFQKLTLISPLIPIENLYLLGTCEGHGSGYKFSKYLFWLGNSDFIIGNKHTLSVVFLEVTGSLHFQENFCYLRKFNLSLLVVLPSKNSVR